MLLDTLITGARSPAGEKLSVGIVGERIAYLSKEADAQTIELQVGEHIAADDELLLPGLIEPHSHIDKTYSVGALPSGPASEQGALRDAIVAMAQHKAERSIDDMLQRAGAALDRAIVCGVSALRSHVDIGEPSDLDNLRGLLDLQRARRDSIELKLTVLSDPGSQAGFALSQQALALGADAIGGAPALTENPLAGIDACFELAEATGCDIDLHVDENENPASPCLAYLATEMNRRGWEGRVSAGHCCSLSFVEQEQQAKLIAEVQQAGIDVITLPACNLFLMGRNQYPTPRGIAPVNALQAAGVNVCVGTDNVQDPFHPMGDYDPLANAALLINSAHFGGGEIDRALQMTAQNAAKTLGIDEDYGLQVGAYANFSLYRCTSVLQAMTEKPTRSRVIYRGRTVLSQGHGPAAGSV
ncbi:MAG: amidohydrolase family protein [Pseudomonadota bacterium]